MAVLEAVRPEIAGRERGETVVRDVRMEARERPRRNAPRWTPTS